MTTEQVWDLITEIDNQLVLLYKKKQPLECFKPLLNLRNTLLIKYRPAADLNWQIQDKRLLNFFKKENWHVQWVSPDVPIKQITVI